jgi:hypothetical protein
MIQITKKEFLEKYPIGSLVTAYKSGYHEIINVEERFREKDTGWGYIQVSKDHPKAIEMNPLITVKQRFRFDGTIVKRGAISSCDSSFIVDMCEHIKGVIKDLEEEVETLKDFLNQHNNAKTTD